ncbi:MAG TPA: universal stress protein [Gammaproteobacteria bacterium]|nr:universal stress protein [Gammaproteobacteria bacterium]
MATATCLMVIVDKNLRLTPALVRAAALARKSGERLLLALFEFDRVLDRAVRQGFDLQAYLDGRRQKLESLATPLRRDGLAVETRVFWGRPIMARMMLAVLAEQPQMVIKDVHAEPTLKRLLFTPEDLDLLRQCPAPLMLVRTGARSLPQRILAAVDPLDEHDRPHELNTRVLKAANRLAMQCDAQLDVVHAFEFIPPPVDGEFMTGWLPDFTLAEELRGLHLDELQKLGKEFGVPKAHLYMLDGHPDRTVSEFAANHKHDVVVMGTVQRNLLQRLALGSVAEGLLQRLDCDVLTLKPEGFAEHLQTELGKVKLDEEHFEEPRRKSACH